MSGMRCLTVGDAIAIHDLATGRFGGEPGVRDEDALEAALTQPWASFGGCDLYDGAVGKGCRCAYDVIRDKPFVEGNASTGAALLATCLRMAGIEFTPAHDELLATLLAVDDGSMDYDGLVAWVRSVV